MFEIINLLTTKSAIGILPTDTIYGIVACANNPTAVAKLYKLKHRKKPGTVMAVSIDQLVELGLKKSYLKAVKDFWPGPISVIIPCDDKLQYLHLGLFGLAVRIPDDKNTIEILKKTGPLMTTSANPPGSPPATNIETAKAYFGNKVDFYLNGGNLDSKASTIIRVIDDEVVVVRQGDQPLP